MKFTSLSNPVGVILFLIASFSAQSQVNPNPSEEVDLFIQTEMQLERFPGVATVIVKDDRIIWLESYGFANIESAVLVEDTTVFSLASVSKLFTGTAAMQLAENNVIDLDQDVNLHLPWLLEIPGFQGIPVTFRQLMTHSSSIRDNFNVMDTYYDFPDPSISLEDCMERYFSVDGLDYNPNANFLAAAPGSEYEYSNMATALNGYLVELAAGMAFDTYCNENLFQPLCMNKTAWFFADFNPDHVATPYQYQGGNYVPYEQYGFADYPDGQLRSTAVDMANFMIAYLNEGIFGQNAILNPSSIAEMWSPQVPFLDPTQGLNWYLEELYHSNGTSMLWGHNGGEQGVSTDVYLDPINKIGICVLANGEGTALYICDELYDYALSLGNAEGVVPDCLSTGLNELSLVQQERTLLKITDYLGRETEIKFNTPLIKMYSDGSTERVYIIE